MTTEISNLRDSSYVILKLETFKSLNNRTDKIKS